MTFPCRCSNCRTRRSLRRRPADYIRQPACAVCGKRNWYIDRYRIKVEMAYSRSCNCGGYHFIHRKGSKYCDHHPNVEQNQGERYDTATH